MTSAEARPLIVAGERTVPTITAEAAMVFDDTSGITLTAVNADQERPMASVTKIMTAYVVVRHGNLADLVVISGNAAAVGEAEIGLFPEEVWSVEELLTAIMVRSANDAAVALAEHIGGSVEGFADLMNLEAQRLGLSHSRFVNPHGLDAEGHYTSARDLVTLTHAALEEPVIARLARTKVAKFRDDPEGKTRRAVNTNALLGAYPGVVGFKTGFTGDAGRVLVTVVEEGDRRLIAVVMGSDDHFADSRALIDWGLATFGLRDRLLSMSVPEQGGGATTSALVGVAKWVRDMPDMATGLDRTSNMADTVLGRRIGGWLRAGLPQAFGGGV
jgi:D-alanyl-D-alanine carboxypeptidase